MVDYVKGTGAGGLMMIRDHGFGVDFFIKAGSGNTFVNQMPYNWVVNGVAGSGTIRYPAGGEWLHVMTFTISTTQDVKFGIGNTGTSGLGGPTDFWQRLGRSTVPGAPTVVSLSQVSGNAVLTSFQGISDGGSPIEGWEVAYGTSSAGPAWAVASNGVAAIGNLQPNTVYYFWARGRNAHGWGPYGPMSSVRTATIPAAPDKVLLSEITQKTMLTRFSGNSDGRMPILQWQLGYGTSSSSPSTLVTSNGTLRLTTLEPGTTYYFWARGRNGVGWGPWSARATARTIAGARVKVGTVWKEAVPYVNVNGVWKLARPWVKQVNTWKESR